MGGKHSQGNWLLVLWEDTLGKERNRFIGIEVAKWLREHGPASTPEIGRALGLNVSAVGSAFKHADDWFEKTGVRVGPPRKRAWQWSLRPGVVLPGEGIVGIEAEIYNYMQSKGRASTNELSGELGYTQEYCARILAGFPDLFRFVGKMGKAPIWEHIDPAQQCHVVEPVISTPSVIEWTHTSPNGRSWTLSGKVVDRTVDGALLVLSHGELFEVAA